MATLTLTAKGRAPVDTAWDRYLYPARWSEWSPQISRVEASADAIAAGVTGRVVGPFGVSVRFVVDAVDPAARTWTWTVRRPPLTLQLRHSVSERSGGGSRTALTVDGPLPVLLGYAPLARFALGRLVAG